MKRKSLLKILILFILAGTIANAEYFKENGEVYYKMPYFEIKSKVKGADAKTLENVGEDNMEMAGFFGKDSKNTYFIGKKIKDVSPKGFDGRGNYTLGLREQIVFPEIEIDKVDKIFGLGITIVSTAENDEQGRALLKAFGMPFAK